MTHSATTCDRNQLRGFGWDIDSPFASNRGELFPVGSFGHTGFTGTSLWIDPVTDTYVIILTNAVHPTSENPSFPCAARSPPPLSMAFPHRKRKKSCGLRALPAITSP